MERESSKECSAFFLWRKGSFHEEIVLRGIQPYFCSVFGLDPWFQPLKTFSGLGVFPPFVGQFFKRAREPEVKLHDVVYEVLLVSYLFFSFQIWYFPK